MQQVISHDEAPVRCSCQAHGLVWVLGLDSCLLSGVGSRAQGHAGGSDGFLSAALPPQEERHA